ncbi:zinc knuckle CX2CX4HX4C containing protein [Tanacetum coccineum]
MSMLEDRSSYINVSEYAQDTDVVNPTHVYYNGSRTSQDKEDPSWSTSIKTRRQRRHLQHWKRLGCHFILLYLYLIGTFGTSKMFNEAVNNGNKLMVDGDEGSILEDTADVNTVINAPNVSIPIPETNKEPMYVIFDEELIKDGSSKWKLTLCGCFVRHKISINDLRYNIKRMWSRHGFKEVTENDCGMFFFRFHHERGLNYVVENGPWMVNNKPLVVQRWDINMSIDKTEPHKLPLKVKYDWTPPLCSDCGMFRHSKEKRPKTPKDSIACDTDNDGTTNAKESTDDGFTKVKNKRFEKHNVVKKQNYKPDTQSKKNVLNGGGANNQKYKPKVATNDKSNVMEKDVGVIGDKPRFDLIALVELTLPVEGNMVTDIRKRTKHMQIGQKQAREQKECERPKPEAFPSSTDQPGPT